MLTNVLITVNIAVTTYFGVRNTKAFNWIKLTFVPWFVSIGKAVNPDHK